jgi:hypothetical protein
MGRYDSWPAVNASLHRRRNCPCGLCGPLAQWNRWSAGQKRRVASSPLRILQERFARGEIDREEYEERRRVLGE